MSRRFRRAAALIAVAFVGSVASSAQAHDGYGFRYPPSGFRYGGYGPRPSYGGYGYGSPYRSYGGYSGWSGRGSWGGSFYSGPHGGYGQWWNSRGRCY
jgi:hypothetical protein